MKTDKFQIGILALMLFTSLIFTSCSDKTEIVTNGTLEVSFAQNTSDIIISIYESESGVVPIYNQALNGDQKLSTTLNIGNYYIQCRSSSMIIPQKTGFQINSKNKTQIRFANTLDATVSYN